MSNNRKWRKVGRGGHYELVDGDEVLETVKKGRSTWFVEGQRDAWYKTAKDAKRAAEKRADTKKARERLGVPPHAKRARYDNLGLGVLSGDWIVNRGHGWELAAPHPDNTERRAAIKAEAESLRRHAEEEAAKEAQARAQKEAEALKSWLDSLEVDSGAEAIRGEDHDIQWTLRRQGQAIVLDRVAEWCPAWPGEPAKYVGADDGRPLLELAEEKRSAILGLCAETDRFLDPDAEGSGWRAMTSKYSGVCCVSGAPIHIGDAIYWRPSKGLGDGDVQVRNLPDAPMPAWCWVEARQGSPEYDGVPVGGIVQGQVREGLREMTEPGVVIDRIEDLRAHPARVDYTYWCRPLTDEERAEWDAEQAALSAETAIEEDPADAERELIAAAIADPHPVAARQLEAWRAADEPACTVVIDPAPAPRLLRLWIDRARRDAGRRQYERRSARLVELGDAALEIIDIEPRIVREATPERISAETMDRLLEVLERPMPDEGRDEDIARWRSWIEGGLRGWRALCIGAPGQWNDDWALYGIAAADDIAAESEWWGEARREAKSRPGDIRLLEILLPDDQRHEALAALAARQDEVRVTVMRHHPRQTEGATSWSADVAQRICPLVTSRAGEFTLEREWMAIAFLDLPGHETPEESGAPAPVPPGWAVLDDVELTRSGPVVELSSPYCDDATTDFRKIAGRRWESDRKVNVFVLEHEDAIRDLCLWYWGHAGDGEPVRVVDLDIEVRGWSGDDKIQLRGYEIAYKKYRDSRPALHDRAEVIEGKLQSRGGSRKNPRIESSGAVIRLRRVPREWALEIAAEWDRYITIHDPIAAWLDSLETGGDWERLKRSARDSDLEAARALYRGAERGAVQTRGEAE